MKKILFILVALFSVNVSATVSDDLIGLGMKPEHADYIEDILSNAVVDNNTYLKGRNAANTANVNLLKLDSSDNTVINSSASDLLRFQLEDDASRLINFSAASDSAIATTFGDAGVTATQQWVISASTADADDDANIVIAGGGLADGTQGGYVQVKGNEASGGGDVVLYAGASSGSAIDFGINNNSEATITNDKFTATGASFSFVPGATSFLFRNTADNATNLSIVDAGSIVFRDTFIGTGTSTIGWAVVAGANTACTTTCVTPCVFGVNTAATEADIVACSDATADECLCAGAT